LSGSNSRFKLTKCPKAINLPTILIHVPRAEWSVLILNQLTLQNFDPRILTCDTFPSGLIHFYVSTIVRQIGKLPVLRGLLEKEHVRFLEN
jgi:hypothetical protein